MIKCSTKLLGALIVSAASLAASADVSKAGIITQFTFDSYTAPTAATATVVGPIADTGTGTSSGVHASASTVYSTPAGNGTVKSFSSNNWAIGDYYQFTTDLTGVTNSELEFAQVSSTTGPLAFAVEVSTDGSTFTTVGSYAVSGSVSFSAGTVKTTNPPLYLFDISALDGSATATVRLVATSAASGTGGTDRVDTVTFGTDLPAPTVAVPEPASLGLLALGGASLLTRRRK